MEYRFDVDSWGGQFSVPCCVASEYLKISDGNYIKILLCILSSATRSIDSKRIMSVTGLGEDVIEDAIIHWTSLGVLKLLEKSDRDGSAHSGVQTAPVCSVESVKPSEKVIDRKIVVSYSTQEILEKANNDKELKHLFDEIQNYIKNSVNGKELGILTDLYEVYHFDVPTILIAAQYCNTLGKYNVQYLSKLLKSWFEQDLTSYDDIEAEIVRRTEFRSYENIVRRHFGLTNRLTPKQTEYITKWKSYNIDESLLDIACEKCLDATGGKINFKYIDTVICSWVGKGIKTPQQVKEDDENHKGRHGGFVASGKENSYSIDKIEEMAKNFVSRNEDTDQ